MQYCKNKKISNKQFQISPEEKELYLYGLRIFIQWIINVVVIISVGILTKMITECLSMLLTFMIIRKFSGGIHLEKFLLCLFSSGVILLCGICLIKHQWFVEIWLFRCGVLFSTILLSIISPVIHPNKDVSAHEIKIYRLIAIIITTIFMLITMVLLEFPKSEHIGYSIGTGIVLCSILSLAGKLKYKKES